MHRPRILIADDTPDKLAAMESVVRSSHSRYVIDTATSARQALHFLTFHKYEKGVIDFDFPGEHGLAGDDIVRSMRRKNAGATIVCATAREEGRAVEEAKSATIAEGANRALCFLREDFASDLSAALAA